MARADRADGARWSPPPPFPFAPAVLAVPYALERDTASGRNDPRSEAAS